MTRLNLEIKMRIITLMTKAESVTLVKRALKQELFKDIPKSKTIHKIYRDPKLIGFKLTGKLKKHLDNNRLLG